LLFGELASPRASAALSALAEFAWTAQAAAVAWIGAVPLVSLELLAPGAVVPLLAPVASAEALAPSATSPVLAPVASVEVEEEFG
jgi:hypothetical protein